MTLSVFTRITVQTKLVVCKEKNIIIKISFFYVYTRYSKIIFQANSVNRKVTFFLQNIRLLHEWKYEVSGHIVSSAVLFYKEWSLFDIL